jgi:hypothetical protein
MSSTAVWLLDIDGVINACPRNRSPFPSAWPQGHWIDTKVTNRHSDTPWPILAAEDVVAFINRVDDEGLATILWHSTWSDESNKVGEAVGLHPFGVLPAPEHEGWTKGARGWWKLPGAQRALRDNIGHLVWTDDDACHPDMSKDERRLFRDAGALLVAPNPTQGLVQANLDRIWHYLTGDQEEVAA